MPSVLPRPIRTLTPALSFVTLVLAACSSGGSSPPARPVPAPPPPAEQTTTRTPATTPAAPAEREAADGWHLMDDSYGAPGTQVDRALRELLANRQPARTVVVAVIDGGTDTAHVDLRANLWSNPREVAGNGRDDDNNGYVDDVRGWNFIGGANGQNVNHDTFEVTRLYAQCQRSSAGGDMPAAEQQRCDAIRSEFEERRSEAEQTLEQIRMIQGALEMALPVLRQALGDSLSLTRVTALRPASQEVAQARSIYMQLAAAGITPKDIEEGLEAYESQVQYGFDPEFNPRDIVGDRYEDTSERRYGNNDVTGPDAKHGTHVAGIIGAVRGNNTGVDGIAPAVRLMILRTVPDGDERDKDVANAIRYAADNGAHIINMSFGKSHSPFKQAVDEAVKYAESRGVLLVHAAGNDGEDLSTKGNFPTPVFADGTRAANWIEVGASSWRGADSLAANFSNYGRGQVDVFAPGEDILSTVPGGGYERESGTSMAAPVVSGVAALLMSYFPTLTAADVKRIILETATKRGEQSVVRPGGEGGPVRFGELSATGGIINAYEAVRMAERMTAPRS